MSRVDGTPTTGTATAPAESGVAGFDQTKNAQGFLGTKDPSGHPTGVFGTSPGHGVVGQTASSAAFGILGVNTAPGGVAIKGTSTPPSPPDHGPAGGVGVSGEALGYSSVGVAGSGETGVLGMSGGAGLPTPQAGVRGASISNFGVYGVSRNSVGVWGLSLGSTGVIGEAQKEDGVLGISHDKDHAGISGTNDVGGVGVKGESTASGAAAVGVRGKGSGAGVYGENQEVSAIGLLGGRDQLNNQLAGVFGKSSEQGVYGFGDGDNATGVYGVGKFGVRGDAGTGGIGVKGSAQAGIGVWGESSGGNGVLGESLHKDFAGMFASNEMGGLGLIAASTGPDPAAARFDGAVWVNGTLTTNGNHCLNGNLQVGSTGDIILGDCAEEFECATDAVGEPGSVMVLDELGAIRPCSAAYEGGAIGVVSGAGIYRPAIVLDRKTGAEGRAAIALVGKVCCKVDASFGAIRVGDLLTSSPTTGHAMRATDPARSFGAVVGRALKGFQEGCGLIPILVLLR